MLIKSLRWFAKLLAGDFCSLCSHPQNAFGLNKYSDASKRIVLSGNYISFWDKNVAGRKVKAFPRQFAEGLISNRFLPYDFERWVSMLS